MEFDSLVPKRRSIRIFKPGGVTFGQVKEIIEAGRHGLSAGNQQPWKFLIVSSDRDKASIKEICEKSDAQNLERQSDDVKLKKPFAFLDNCSFMILVFGNKEKMLWKEACWSAITLMCLKTADLGLGTFPYSPPMRTEINRLFNAPATWKLVTILPVGDPDEFPAPDDRPRKELDKVMFRVEDMPRVDRHTKKIIKKQESETTDFLKSLPIFDTLTDAIVDELAAMVTVRDLKKGDVIVKKGDPPENFFIIADGMVEILSGDAKGNERVITFLGQGECFGEMSIISGEPISATVRATGDISVIVLSKRDFLEIVQENPQLNFFFTSLITKRLAKTNLKLVEESLMQGLTGKLSIISLPELIQAMNISGKSGILELTNEEGMTGKVYVSGGNIIDVEMGDAFGDEVFFEFLTWPDGEFSFSQEDVDRETRVTLDTMGLLMEGMRVHDEHTRMIQKDDVPEKEGEAETSDESGLWGEVDN